MRVTVVRPTDLGDTEAKLWADFQRQSPASLSPFMSLTYAKAVGGARHSARVAVVEDNGTIEAFLPYELAAGNVAIPIGYPMNDLQGLIGSGAPIDVRAVVRNASLHGWRFHHAPAEQEALAPFYYTAYMEQSPVIDLSGGYEAYLSSRSKAVSKRSREQRRAVERQLGPITLDWASSRPDALRQLLDWQFARYIVARRTFADDPTALPIVEALASADNDDCRGQMTILLAGERPVAGHLYLAGPRGLTGTVTSYDQSLSKFSPGTMMYFAVSEAAANRGITRIELGYGELHYKMRLATSADLVAAGAVWANRLEGVARKLVRRVYVDRINRKAGQASVLSGRQTSDEI